MLLKLWMNVYLPQATLRRAVGGNILCSFPAIDSRTTCSPLLSVHQHFLGLGWCERFTGSWSRILVGITSTKLCRTERWRDRWQRVPGSPGTTIEAALRSANGRRRRSVDDRQRGTKFGKGGAERAGADCLRLPIVRCRYLRPLAAARCRPPRRPPRKQPPAQSFLCAAYQQNFRPPLCNVLCISFKTAQLDPSNMNVCVKKN